MPIGSDTMHKFQSTLPARGATDLLSRRLFLFTISIHAPRTGSDSDKLADRSHSIVFQSTLPARGATRHEGFYCSLISISIHAPRTGSDADVIFL